ncbi:IS3 family transposase [Desulfovibrio aerotolerans]|uniref:IS3 family transposase n=1 Tax=Solidesulfovibrio aerotolerans TaxID=295255 RepID=A0A7C9ML54_9BACT|nr:IS3 family transposase [Solidesulfovibrio aerotolerans]
MNLDLMRRIGELFLETPFYGSRQMRLHLQHQDIVVDRGSVRRLMRRMGLMAIYQKPKPVSRILRTRSIRICCAGCRLIGQIRCGASTVRTCQ